MTDSFAFTLPLRQLGGSDIYVSPVSLGCWPISGMTSLHVTRDQSLATLRAAIELGINFFDTAYCYGAEGESECLIADVLRETSAHVHVATKGGVHWDANGQRQLDARPQRLLSECETSLQRLSRQSVDVFYLHAPDANTPIEESAAAIAEMISAGMVRCAGASNCNLEQLRRFHAACPLTVIQPPYNMLMRDIEAEMVPWCIRNQIAIACYWPLMKGLLAGKLPRDHAFEARDGRAKYPMFQGEQWRKNQDFVDQLRAIAGELGKSVAEIAVQWTIQQPGITTAICGAKRPDQIAESAAALTWRMDEATMAKIDAAIEARGEVASRWAV